MRCLFPDLYPVRKLLIDHHELLKPGGFTESVVMDVSVSQVERRVTVMPVTVSHRVRRDGRVRLAGGTACNGHVSNG